MEGVPSVVTPHNLAGFSWNFSITLSTCSEICYPVVVEERLAISKNSSTISNWAVTTLMKMTSWAVSLTSDWKLHTISITFKISLISSERSFVLRKTVKQERLVCSAKCFFFLRACIFCEYCQTISINSPSLKGFHFSAIDSQSLKLSFVTSSEFFSKVIKTPCFLMDFFKCSVLSTRAWPTILSNWEEYLIV